MTTHEEIWADDGWLAAGSESVLVAHDPETRRSREMLAQERAAFEAQLAAV